MTLRASMLVPLIYGPPNLRRVTYIVSPPVRVSLYTRCLRYLDRGLPGSDLDLGKPRNGVSSVFEGSTRCKPSSQQTRTYALAV